MSTLDPSSLDLIDLLTERGFLHQCTDLDGLRQLLAAGSVTTFLGFDATADSLHVGHLQGLMLMRWLQKAGHHPLLLVGGGTTRVGDPSFREQGRVPLTREAIEHNIAGLSRVFGQLLSFAGTPNPARVVNNAQWLDSLNFLDFLTEVGRHFSVNRMLTMDAIKSRLAQTLSFQEFGYTLLQAFDFAELARREGCRLQIGGADQWANILNGIDLARRQDGVELFGLTTPLLTSASGQKMGKTADGAVWLDPEKLAPFEFWQFWRNVDDRDVGRFLGLFTELPMDEVRRLAALTGAGLNHAKEVLACECTRLVHGEAAAQACLASARSVFTHGVADAGLPELVLSSERVAAGVSLFELAVDAGFVSSRSAARRAAVEGALRLDGLPVPPASPELPAEGTAWRLSFGKKRHVRILRG